MSGRTARGRHGAVRATLLVVSVCIALLAAGTSAASAAEFFVAPTGNNANTCSSSAVPCMTIMRAVEEARLSPGAATVRIAAGTYPENLDLESDLDNGLRLVGAGSATTVLRNTVSNSTLLVGGLISVTVENLTIEHPTADREPAVRNESSAVTLAHDLIRAKAAAKETAIESDGALIATTGVGTRLIDSTVVQESPEGVAMSLGAGSVTVTGSTVETTAPNSQALGPTHGSSLGEDFAETVEVTGSTVVTRGTASSPLDVDFAHLKLNKDLIEAAGMNSQVGNLFDAAATILASRIVGKGSSTIGLNGEDCVLTLEHDSIEVEGALALEDYLGRMVMRYVTVNINAPGNTNPAIATFFVGAATLSHVRVGGVWAGSAVGGYVANGLTITDSRLTSSETAKEPTVNETTGPGSPSLLIRRTVITAPADAPAALRIELQGSAAIDSSEIVGGAVGARFADDGPKRAQVVVAGSTIDAGTAGVAGEPLVSSIAAEDLEPGPRLSVFVQGSILFEPIEATLAGGAAGLSVACSNSDTPGQTRPESATLGSIACRSGAHGNDALPGLGSIFASPFTSYLLRPHSSAINSVPSSSIALGFGVKASSTDLAGRARELYRRVRRRCELVQDRGALQVRGQRADCKPPRRKRRR